MAGVAIISESKYLIEGISALLHEIYTPASRKGMGFWGNDSAGPFCDDMFLFLDEFSFKGIGQMLFISQQVLKRNHKVKIIVVSGGRFTRTDERFHLEELSCHLSLEQWGVRLRRIKNDKNHNVKLISCLKKYSGKSIHPRQEVIKDLIVRNKNVNQIADITGLSTKTVYSHLSKLQKELGQPSIWRLYYHLQNENRIIDSADQISHVSFISVAPEGILFK